MIILIIIPLQQRPIYIIGFDVKYDLNKHENMCSLVFLIDLNKFLLFPGYFLWHSEEIFIFNKFGKYINLLYSSTLCEKFA